MKTTDNDVCTCLTPNPYHPVGVCAPIVTPGHCLTCQKRVVKKP